MSNYWKARVEWQGDPIASLREAERRVAACVERKDEGLYLADLDLERLPDGLGTLTWLKELRATGGRIADLSSLAPLRQLRVLEVGSLNCPFPGLEFMRGWSHLEVLQLITRSGLDLTPMASCSKLKRLSIWSTQHTICLRGLNSLPSSNLEHVSLYGTHSDEFESISEWRRVKFLQLISTNLPSLAGLENLRDIQHLSLSRAPVDDIVPLSDCRGLEEITLQDVPVDDISPLAGLPALRRLILTNTLVSDLKPLEQLGRAQDELYAEQRKTAQVYFRRGLESLELDSTRVMDLDPLANLVKLDRLSLSDTGVSSLEAVRSCTAMRSLDISRTAVRTLGPAGSMKNLVWLKASGTPIRSLAALAPASALQGIDITNTAVFDLSPLRAADQCRSLHLRGSQVRDLGPILHTGSVPSQDRGDSREFLDFRDTPASRLNKRLAELSLLAEQSPERCFHETKAYLRERRARLWGWLFG